MNDPQRTRPLRAGQAIKAARDARKRISTHTKFVRIVAAQLQEIAPGTARVRTVPVTHQGRRRTWVILDDAAGRPVGADLDAHRAAYGLLQRAFPAADWTVPRVYDATTGDLAADLPPVPAELGIDDAPYADMTTADAMTAEELHEADQAAEYALDAADEARYADEEGDL